MKELTEAEYYDIAGGALNLVVALAVASFAYINHNWVHIKKAAVDAWNDTRYL